MTIAYPYAFFLFILLAVLFFFAWRRSLPALKVPFLNPFREAAGGKGKISFRYRVPLLLYTLGAALLIVALARPRKGLEEIKQRAEGIDIIAVVDLSGSMKSMDVPNSIVSEAQLRNAIKSGELKDRLEVSKNEINRFMSKRPNDRIGLIGFAQLPYNISPLTLDHGWLDAMLKPLRPGIIGDATGIAAPLASAVHRLKDSEAKRKIIVLFTDGSNNVETAITPLQAAKLAKKYDIAIYTVGIGSRLAYALQNTLFGEQLIPIQGEFDDALLKEIAKTSGGRYYKAEDAEGMRKAMDEIDKLEKTSFEQPRIIDYKEFAFDIMTLAAACILLAFLLEHSLLMRVP